jgi:hypothetical protein
VRRQVIALGSTQANSGVIDTAIWMKPPAFTGNNARMIRTTWPKPRAPVGRAGQAQDIAKRALPHL